MGTACPAPPVPRLVCPAELLTFRTSMASHPSAHLRAHPEPPSGSGSHTGTVDILALHSMRQDSVGPGLGFWASIDAMVGAGGASGRAQQEPVARTTASFQRTQLNEMFS